MEVSQRRTATCTCQPCSHVAAAFSAVLPLDASCQLPCMACLPKQNMSAWRYGQFFHHHLRTICCPAYETIHGSGSQQDFKLTFLLTSGPVSSVSTSLRASVTMARIFPSRILPFAQELCQKRCLEGSNSRVSGSPRGIAKVPQSASLCRP